MDDGKNISILLVEDEESVAKYISTLLAKEKSYQIIHSPSLKKALNQLKTKNIDLILLDLALGDSRGLDTLKAVHSVSDAPIFVITGRGDEELGKQSFHFGATDFLHKSDLTPALLLSAVQYTIEKSRIASGEKQYQLNLAKMVEDRTRELKQANLILENEIRERKKTEANLKKALQQSQRREKEVEALLKGAHAILTHQTFPVAARKVFDICRDLIGATAGYVALLSEDGAENEVLFLEAGGLPCDVDPDLPMPIRGLREKAYRRIETVFDNDFKTSQWMAYMPKGHVTLDNVLFAPLKLENRAVGLLGLANKPGGFNENDAGMATAFGEIASIALKNSRTMEELVFSENQFRSLVETCPDPIIIYDVKGNVRYANEAFSGLFGWETGDIVSNRLDFVPEQNREETRFHLDRMLAGEKVVNFETRRATKDGRILDIDISAALFKDDNFKPAGSATFFRDITERKLLEKRIRQSEKNIRKIIESIHTAVVVVNTDTRIIEYVNTMASEMIGLAKDKIIGQVCHCFICPAEAGKCPVADMEQKVDNSERVLLTARGEKVPILKTVSRIQMENKECAIESFVDISDMKKAEKERLARKELQASIETAGAACHELNQPLQTIMNLAEAVLDEISEDHPLHEDLAGILGNTHKMAEITRRLNNITLHRTKRYSDGTDILDLSNSATP